jgi:hypothetical protein
MKKALTTIFCIALALCFLTSTSFAAAKREKFGSDPRHEIAKRVKFKTSRPKKSLEDGHALEQGPSVL